MLGWQLSGPMGPAMAACAGGNNSHQVPGAGDQATTPPLLPPRPSNRPFGTSLRGIAGTENSRQVPISQDVA